MRAGRSRGTVHGMRHEASSRRSQPASLRVLLIDDHEVPRAACRALLRTEGIDVVADMPVCEDALAAAIDLRPDVAIVDVIPEDERPFVLVRRLRSILYPPTVVLVSSTSRVVFGPKLHGALFIDKADLCSSEIRATIRASRDSRMEDIGY